MNKLVKFNELKEWKKLKKGGLYGIKSILISKVELGNICNELNIDIDKVRFISSGFFGNAYSFDDKVMKITSDLNESKMISDILKSKKDNKSIVKYYGIWRYKSKRTFSIIIMDKVIPLSEKVKDNINLFNFVTDTIFRNWGFLKYDEYISSIESKYTIKKTFMKNIINDIWKCYSNLKHLPTLDFHIYNLGYSKNNDLVIFDITPLDTKIRRFDDAPILFNN